MTGLLRRLARPQRRGWLAAALFGLAALTLVAVPRPRPPQAIPPAAVGAAPAEALAALIEVTADPRSMIAEADAARKANAELPLVKGGLQTARPFGLPASIDPFDADRAVQCLALAMYYEAAFEGPGGRQAVAQVVLNRVRHPAFPNSVCAVVFQRSANHVCQFTFACDGSMVRLRIPQLWQQTIDEAAAALAGQVFAPVGMATHYHADYVFPYWAPRLDKIAVVGTHVFYRWPRGWGLHRAFTAVHAGNEPELAGLDLPPPEPDQPPAPLPEELGGSAGEVAPMQSTIEGGFVDPAKGWVPRISLPRGASPAPSLPAPTETTPSRP